MTEPTTPQLSETDVAKIETRLTRITGIEMANGRHPASWDEVSALVRDWKAMRARLTACESSRRVHELDNHHNALACGYCAGPIKDESMRLMKENAGLRQWKAEALPLLTRYDNLAETFGGKLGSSKVTNLERGVAALREQLAQAESLASIRSDIIAAKAAHVDELQSQLAQVTSERDEARRELQAETERQAGADL